MDEARGSGAPRFLIDGMAVRVGKYLRCLGFDAAWDQALGTRALARRAAAEGRVLVTRNSRVGGEIAAPPRCVVLAREDPVEALHQVVEVLGLDPRARLFTRCIRCNVALRDATGPEVEERVPARVRPRYRRFFTCPACGTVFWRGSHVGNTCRKLGIEPPEEDAAAAEPGRA